MKKLLALLAVVLCVVSCQTEPEGLDVNVGGEIDAIVNVTIPEAETRATNSAEGAFKNVDLGTENDTKTIRYILKIYQKIGDNYVASNDRQVEYSDRMSVVFPVRLVPNRDYRFVVWADYVENKDDRDLHYNTTDLANITLNDTWVAMDETRDAFTGYFDTVAEGKQYTSSSSINITLKRPFAKLRVITTDMKELGYLGIAPHNAAVTYTTQFHESFNAFNGQYGAETVSKTHSFEIKAYGDNVDKKSKVLFTDYFFADDSDVVKFVMNVNEANGALIKSNAFNTDIAVRRNYLTTIKGNILTDGNNVTVEVEDAFENGSTWNPNEDEYDYATISSEAELLAAINGQGGEYVVTSDIDVTGLVASTQAATRTTGTTTPTTTTINLNGKTITVTNKTNAPFATVAAGNTLFLEGGNIVLAEGSTASFIKNEGNVVFTNGTLENESNHNTAAVVEGKVIVEENATVNDDNTKKVTNWLADVLKNGGTYLFTEDLESSEIIEVTAEAPVVLDGNGKTLTSTAGRAINVSGAQNVTIKNLTINASGERAINIIKNAKNITIDNVTATAANYTVNVATSAPGAVVAINNSTLNGLCTVNVASAGARVTVDGSTVNCNDNNTTAGESYAALCLIKEAVGGKIIATNSTINVTEGSDSTAGRNGAEDGEVTIDGSVDRVVVTYAVITYTGSDYYYGFQTIQAAIDFAKDGDKISLIRNVVLTEPLNIPEGKNVVLDLNGKTITTTEEQAGRHLYAIENYGSLTIQDSKGNGKIEARGNFNYGTMTLESGIIDACDGNGGYGVRNYEGAEFIMNGGSIVTSYEDGDTPGNGYDASPVRVDEGATATINGGAINNVSNYTVAIDNHGETTINGGTFTTIHTTIANSATMTINGGSFTCNGLEGVTAHALWADAGTTTINGGTFDGKDNYNGFNVDADKGAIVNINGGKFLPVHSGSLYGEGTIIVKGGEFFDNPSARVAEGYKASKISENKYMVVAEGNTVVSTADELVAALEADQDVIFANDIKIDPASMSNAYGKTGINVNNGETINGNGYTLNIKGAGGTWDSGINTTGGLIKDLTVTGSFRGIFINHNYPHSEKVVLENVTITGTIYTISCDQGMYQGIEATDCTFNGWTSFAETAGEAKFVNCSFGEGSGYKYCRPYSKTEFVNCTFCPGYYVDTTEATVTFTDCTWEE